MRRNLARAATATGIGIALTVGAWVGDQKSAPEEQPIPCSGLASWQHLTSTYGYEEADALWTNLIEQGWTNTYSGDTSYLVEPGCAGAWT